MQVVLQLYLIVREWDGNEGRVGLATRIARLEWPGWVRIFSPSFSAAGLIMSQMDFLCENDRFVHETWRRDKPLVMGCTMWDLFGQLVLRVVPLCVLMAHHLPIGGAVCILGFIWAIGVTWQASSDEDASEQSCADHFLISVLFFPHAFFFGMTFYPVSLHLTVFGMTSPDHSPIPVSNASISHAPLPSPPLA